jgi:hypothetical protein
MQTAMIAMHVKFAELARGKHFNDNLLGEMLELHSKLANGTTSTGVDTLVDALNGTFDENEKDGMMQGRDWAHMALEKLEEENKFEGMQLLWIACMQRMYACEIAYG